MNLSWPNSELEAQYIEVDTDLREALDALNAKKRRVQKKQKALTQQRVKLRETARKRLHELASQQAHESKQLQQEYAFPSICFHRDDKIIHVTLKTNTFALPPFTETKDHITAITVGEITINPDKTISTSWRDGFSFVHRDTCWPRPTAFVDNTQPRFEVPTFYIFTNSEALAEFLTSPDLGRSNFEWSAERLLKSVASSSQTISVYVGPQKITTKNGTIRFKRARQLVDLTRYAFSVTANYVIFEPTLLIVPDEIRAMFEAMVDHDSIPLSNDLQFLIIEFVFDINTTRMFRELYKLRPRPHVLLKRQKK